MYIIALYSLNHYEWHKFYFSLFVHFKHKARIYNFTHLFKININNHALRYIHINAHK